MQVSTDSKKVIFQLRPVNKVKGMKLPSLTVGRYLVGRAESCEIIIPRNDISAIHAVIEVKHSGMVVYDMNSTNGTFVNKEKIVTKDVALGEEVSFGGMAFKLAPYTPVEDLPPVLKSLDPISGPARTVNPELPKSAKYQVRL